MSIIFVFGLSMLDCSAVFCGSLIFVKQKGHASKVSVAETWRFRVFSGVLKVFLQEAFSHVNILNPCC